MAYINLIDLVYPVGAVYISYRSDNPVNLFGGSWTAITGRFPYFNAGTDTGGSNTHTLSVSQIPSHTHGLRLDWFDHAGSGISDNYSSNTKAKIDAGGLTMETGGGKPHNNMPAYQTLYAWRRIA